MIALKDALAYIGTPEVAQERAALRLRGEATEQIGSRWLDEDPADVLVPLLSDQAPPEIRDAVLRGWRAVYCDVIAWVECPELDHADHSRYWARRLCRVAEIACPRESRGAVSRLLSAAVDNPRSEEDLVYEILSAWRSYPHTVRDLELVDSLMQQERYAAAAFDVLVEIDPVHRRVDEALYGLWCKRHEEGWQVDAAFLAMRLEERVGHSTHVVRVLRKIKSGRPDTWLAVQSELEAIANETGESWPQEWLQSVAFSVPDDIEQQNLVSCDLEESVVYFKEMQPVAAIADAVAVSTLEIKPKPPTIQAHIAQILCYYKEEQTTI